MNRVQRESVCAQDVQLESLRFQGALQVREDADIMPDRIVGDLDSMVGDFDAFDESVFELSQVEIADDQERAGVLDFFRREGIRAFGSGPIVFYGEAC